MSDQQLDIQTYTLPGGSTVTVHKPFGNEIYIADAHQTTDYPGDGNTAVDKGRDEYIVVYDGALTIKLNDVNHTLNPGDSLLINDGSTYQISGIGKAFVLVKDQLGGTTKIVDQSGEPV